MTTARRRLDHELVERGLTPTRSKARAVIMAGQVRIDGRPAAKPGELVDGAATIELDTPSRFVSRGGDKLIEAIEASDIDVAGRLCLDVGASTGGFTDALLQSGAAAVIAVDVGYGQLDWRLRKDPRVHVLERLNARNLNDDDLPAGLDGRPTLLVIDVAFISAAKVLPAAGAVCEVSCDALVLVKPQFECGPDQVGDGGVVTDAGVRRACLEAVGAAAVELGWTIVRAIPSPIRGPAGNWECFLQLRRPPGSPEFASLPAALDAIQIPDD